MSKKKVNKNPLGKYIGINWWRYAISGSGMIMAVLLDMWFPIITMSIVDDVLINGDMQILKRDLICILLIGLGRAVAQYTKEFTADCVGCRVGSSTRKNLFGHMQKLSKSFFNKNNVGELMARVKDDADRLWEIFGFVGMLMLEAFGYIIATTACMLRYNWKLSLVPLVCMPVLGFLTVKLEKKLDKVYDDISEQNATLNTVVQENLSGVRAVKSFAKESYELEKFRKNNEKYSELNVKQALIMAKYDPAITFIPKVMQIGVLLFGGLLVIRKEITPGILIAFIQYASNIIWPMECLGWLTNSAAAAFASNKKINKILAVEPEIYNKENAVDIEEPNGELRFNNVDFTLEGNEILKDVSFDLPKGKTLGIMGVTGSGKSTIVNLIGRFYDVTGGSITIDGYDIRDLTLKTVRKCSSVVTQDVFLFSDTISENIKLGARKSMSDEDVTKSIKTAHAAEFVDKLSKGYDTVIGERGVGLSGGQKQRLSIARALAKNARILILDDSTSALDMETEYEIQQSLADMHDTSKIIIAHRISSVRNADEIIVLNHGQIAERGTHEELLAKKGLYYSTYEAQYGDYHKALEVLGEEELICQ